MKAETKTKKQEKTATRWCVFVEFVFAWCFEVIRRDIVSRYILSWYHIPYHAISQDTIYFEVSRYCIHIPNFRTDIEISHPVEIFLDTEHIFFPISAPSLVHQQSERNNGYLEVEIPKQ